MSWIYRTGFVIHRKITWLLLFSIISLALASWLIYVGERNIERTNRSVNQSYELIGTAQQTIIDLAGSHTTTEQDLARLRQLSRITNDQGHTIKILDSLFKNSGHADSRVIPLLNAIVQEEKALLATRLHQNDIANKRTAHGMLLGRALAFFFVAILLLQLNKDITHRKKTQELLEAAILEASDARQMQQQFLANMSHEIRTPMNGIKGMTDLLMDTPLSGRQHELTGIIKSSVDNLLHIINDILDFSKIKAGKLNIEKIEFDVKDILAGLSTIFEHRLKKKGLIFQMDIDPNIPARLTGDPHRLNQLLTNLLGNAIKFTDQGDIHIRVSVQKRSTAEIMLNFTIADTGIGIPADSIPYIFDSFSQAGRDISRRYGGTGLGLAICRQLLHLQGGDITATSVLGKGSLFTFHLPYGYNDNPLPVSSAPKNIHDYSNVLAGRSFLVAEDNEINQKLIDYVLRKAGGTVEMAGNGLEAIGYLQKGKTFDLIIMDLQMPEMDGYAATRFIRNDLHVHTPIIAMTATAMKGEHLQCLESGMNEYMTKPFEFDDLYKRISGLLNSAKVNHPHN